VSKSCQCLVQRDSAFSTQPGSLGCKPEDVIEDLVPFSYRYMVCKEKLTLDKRLECKATACEMISPFLSTPSAITVE
jgi:hypothetical protein